MVTQETLNTEFAKMILSASGFRKVFAFSGNQEDRTKHISQEDKLICTAAALSYLECLNLSGKTVLMARDARPTGEEICDVISSVLAVNQVKICNAGICSAPEAFAQSKYGDYCAFIYVSASHNPIGHNGFKAGSDGKVFDSKAVKPIISLLKDKISDIGRLRMEYENALGHEVREDAELKKQSLENYADFVRKTTCPSGCFEEFAESVRSARIGIVADLNGSARCNSIDKKFLADLGIKTRFINDIAGEVAHAIVPEAENLDFCRELLKKAHSEDPSFVLGYVPDNDGDRGNLVYADRSGDVHILKAQEVFALCVYSTLATSDEDNIAVAVNCSTSMRIDEIAEKFNAKVFRAEVGEANVVSLAEHLREEGYSVPILGEGANGGNITHPAKVRDPMNTLMCVLKMLVGGKTIDDVLESLPKYTSTDAFSQDGALHLKTQDYKALKAVYEKNFEYEWKNKEKILNGFGIVSNLEYQTEGTAERQEKGNGDKGGLKIKFFDSGNKPKAFIWMRPSGTEPLFRILTDVKGDDRELHDYLNNWQREMILKAQEEVLSN